MLIPRCRYMPLYARPVFMNCVALGFNTFLATLYYSSEPAKGAKVTEEAEEAAAQANA